MTTPPISDPRYPIGRAQRAASLGLDERRAAIDAIAALPGELRAAVAGLDDAQLDTPYRPGGWTVRQLVHHVADSHMNAYIRFRLALTETDPPVKPYAEAAWAELHDALTMPVAISLDLVELLHARLVSLPRATPDADFARTVRHPDNGPMTLDAMLGIYSWHGRHHVAHVTALREGRGW